MVQYPGQPVVFVCCVYLPVYIPAARGSVYYGLTPIVHRRCVYRHTLVSSRHTHGGARVTAVTVFLIRVLAPAATSASKRRARNIVV